MKRHWRVLGIGLVCAALLLSGCSSTGVLPQGGQKSIALPNPRQERMTPAIGEAYASYEQEVRLYYPTVDGQSLAAVVRTVQIAPDQSLPQQVLTMLLTQTPTGLGSAVPAGTKLLDMTVSNGIVTINLSWGAEFDEKAFFRTQCCIAGSLLDLCEVDAVNVLLDGEKPALRTLSCGLIAAADAANLSAQWAQLLADEELINTNPITRNAAIYYPDQAGQYLAPEMAQVTLTSGNALGDVMDFLSRQPGLSCLRAALAEESLLTDSPKLLTTASGERVVKIVLNTNLSALLEKQGLSAWQLYGAITLTLTEFVPELDGVCVYLGEGQMRKVACGDQEINFGSGIMRRSDFEPYIGERVGNVYLTASDGSLQAVDRLISADQAPATARILLEETISGPQAWESALSPVVPEGVTAQDILGVSVADGLATVNLSAHFYRCCQGLSALQERNLAYALVNALTDLPSVVSVQFQREGAQVEYLSSSIYLLTPLIRNPGLLKPS